MNIKKLQNAVEEIKTAVNKAVTTASYGGKQYRDGIEAKEALIRSAGLIQRIHEIAKDSIYSELLKKGINHSIHPPLGETSPELNVWGLLKKKKQDIVVLIDGVSPKREKITEGPLIGQFDELGREATKKSIVIGVRSQLSSVDKNFDTLMERAFAETLNLRMRNSKLIMGEVYLLAVKSYDEQAMKRNIVDWKKKYNNVERFISIFNGISHRTDYNDIHQSFKYERSALVLVDFETNPTKVYRSINELKEDNIVSNEFSEDYTHLSPDNFGSELINNYISRHG